MLVERILDHLAESGFIEKGDAIGDPFGGVALGAIISAYRGYQWYGRELEPEFVELGRQNIEKHRARFERLGVPVPVLEQGDSREFDTFISAILSSPPYISGGHHTDVMEGGNRNGRGQTRSIVTSPPYGKNVEPGRKGSAEREELLPKSERMGKSLSGVVASPPYGDSLDTGGPEKQHPDGYVRSNDWTGYGKTPGQIATLRSGEVNAVVSSPPFLGARSGTTSSAGGVIKDHPDNVGDRTFHSGHGDHRTEGNIEMLAPGQLDMFLTSPPYADSVNSKSHGIDWSKAKPDYPGRVNHEQRNVRHAEAANNMSYGNTAGQIGALKATVTSPPWMDGKEGGRGKLTPEQSLKSNRGHGASDAAVQAQCVRDKEKVYGTSPGQIGNLKKETYWEAMAKVYHACFVSLKPGGVMAVVVKDFVKRGKRMALCDDTMRLLEWVGFEEVERIHAMLVKEWVAPDLFEGERTEKTERKSFFRRVHEKRLAPEDPRRIDYEEVLIVRKPE